MTRAGKGKHGNVLEREYDSTILDMAHAFGWLAHHNTDSRREIGDPGFPDWTFVHRRSGQLVFVETKVVGGRLAVEQAGWHHAIQAGGHEGYLMLLPHALDKLEAILRG